MPVLLSDDARVGVTTIRVPVGAVSADGIGEYLRGRAFPKHGEGEIGCYSTFTVRTDATNMPYEERLALLVEVWDEPEDELIHEASESEGYRFTEDGWLIEVIWLWDGDGLLAFRVWGPRGLICTVANSDCKKSHGWTWVAAPSGFVAA